MTLALMGPDEQRPCPQAIRQTPSVVVQPSKGAGLPSSRVMATYWIVESAGSFHRISWCRFLEITMGSLLTPSDAVTRTSPAVLSQHRTEQQPQDPRAVTVKRDPRARVHRPLDDMPSSYLDEASGCCRRTVSKSSRFLRFASSGSLRMIAGLKPALTARAR